MRRVSLALLLLGLGISLLSCYTVIQHPETHDEAFRATIPSRNSNCLSCHETMPLRAPEYDTWWVHYQLDQQAMDNWQIFQSSAWWRDGGASSSSTATIVGTTVPETTTEPELPSPVIYERITDLPTTQGQTGGVTPVVPAVADSSKKQTGPVRLPRAKAQPETPKEDEKKQNTPSSSRSKK